jgi:DNA-binding PadR family transcriptional regulator
MNFKITEREEKILRFVLEMKFSSVDQIYEKFFQLEASKSSRYAYERLQKLVKAGLLSTQKIHTEDKTYYLITQKGHRLIAQALSEDSLVRPIKNIDGRYFEHDQYVLKCRIFREKTGHASQWISERQLKHQWAILSGGLSKIYMPDAIYTNKKGEKVAFEFELSSKGKQRYVDKVQKFAHLIKSRGPFQRALFVAYKKSVFEFLQEITKPYGNLFLVVKYADFIEKKVG